MAIYDFQNFSDGSNTYRVKDATARTNITSHGNVLMATGEGAHGIRYSNGTLSYKDPATGDWMQIKTSSVISLTQDEYDALSPEEKNKEYFYVITDAYLIPYDETLVTALRDDVDSIQDILGDTSIPSTLGDGTVTGAVSALNTADSGLDSRITVLESKGGLEAKSTVFNSNGSIVETSDSEVVTTSFNADGSITEQHQYKEGDVVVKTVNKTTTFNADGSISETVQEVE